ncbi:MAG: SGNH/GDSL hydrolase family protein [Magnetococcales bacterium]|nr:SGNH/GDSL hydrolase family protein [Magnetococcales bacterium]
MVKDLTLLGAALMVGLLMMEGGVRLYHAIAPTELISDYHLYQYDPLTGSRHKENVDLVWTKEGGGRIRVNNHGLMGQDVSLEKPPGVFRVAILGDSFTEALQVPWDQNFAAILQTHLNHSERAGRVEVLNFGVSGYGTAQAWLTLQHQVALFDPNLIVLAFFPGNDFQDNSRHLKFDPAKPYFDLDESGELVRDPLVEAAFTDYISDKRTAWKRRLLNHLRDHSQLVTLAVAVYFQWQSQMDRGDHTLQAKPTSEATVSLLPASEATPAPILPQFGGPMSPAWQGAWSLTEKLLLEMNQWGREREVPFILMMVTQANQVNRVNRSRYLERYPEADLTFVNRRMGAFAREHHIPYLSLVEPFQALNEASGICFHGVECLQEGSDGSGGGHWNRHGHREAGRLLGLFLERKGLISGEM